MESSKKAVESYWRSRLVDSVTSTEDKVAPVYKLEEICDLLRTSHVSVVKEISEFVLKRLDHKSPIVKQKALRLIKYCVGKSGPEFRREMQRNSAAMRNLVHYRGQPDALKGDALNKAVRLTANEVISTIFAEESKYEPAKEVNKRIQGFGNTAMEMPSEEKRSFLSEVVGLGSASIMHGLSNIAPGHPSRKSDNGNYSSPYLQRSLTTESNSYDRYEPARLPNENLNAFGDSRQMVDGTSESEYRLNSGTTTSEDSSVSLKNARTREEKLLETIVTLGGVRLQPTREAIQVFLVEAAKLDTLRLSQALETKLQSPMWQVRIKALCVLESILRKRDDDHFSFVASYFFENRELILSCSESPQSSLRDKANKVLRLLGWDSGASANNEDKVEKLEAKHVPLPDLLDTGYENDPREENLSNDKREHAPPIRASVDDLLGESFDSGVNSRQEMNHDDDPFNDVSFHAGDASDDVDNLFSGLAVDKYSITSDPSTLNNDKGDLFNFFDTKIEPSMQAESEKDKVTDLISNLSINQSVVREIHQGSDGNKIPKNIFADYCSPGSASNEATSSQGSHLSGMNASYPYPASSMPFIMGNGMMFNPAFQAQSFSYDALATFLAQQQVLAQVSGMQNLGNPNSYSAGLSHSNGVGYASALPDIFQSANANQAAIPSTNNTRKEETRAFDFISDHLAAARDTKRVV